MPFECPRKVLMKDERVAAAVATSEPERPVSEDARVVNLVAQLERLRHECLEMNDTIVLLAGQLDLPPSVLASAIRELPASILASALSRTNTRQMPKLVQRHH